MENQTPTFKKSLSGLSILSIGLGCVVGWSWIIYAGLWGSTPGTLGGVLAFIIAGILCSFIGVVYAELTSIYPRAGGDAVFVFEGLGEIWSVIAGWCTAVLWIGLIFVEVMMIPVILDGLGIFVPQWGPLWNVGGNTVYLSYILVSLVINLLFAYINYRGAEISGRVQTASVFILFGAAVFFFVSGISLGSVENAKPFFTDISGLTLIMLMVPSFMSGFNAIPQLAEEANIPPRNTGRAVVLTVWGSVIFYILIILGLSFAAPLSIRSGEGLVVIDGLNLLYRGSAAARSFVTFASLLGLLTSLNAAYAAGSRLLFSLGRAKFIPGNLDYIHPKYGTPSKVIWLLFALSTVWTFLGTSQFLFVGVTNVLSCFLIIAWILVTLSFLRLRKEKPHLERPYKVPAYKFFGALALIYSIGYLLLYTPISPSGGLTPGEWIVFFVIAVLIAISIVLYRNREEKLTADEIRQRLTGIPMEETE